MEQNRSREEVCVWKKKKKCLYVFEGEGERKRESEREGVCGRKLTSVL